MVFVHLNDKSRTNVTESGDIWDFFGYCKFLILDLFAEPSQATYPTVVGIKATVIFCIHPYRWSLWHTLKYLMRETLPCTLFFPIHPPSS